MDETIATWIIEFLLHQSIEDKVIDGVISSLPSEINGHRLKKTVLLRRIEKEASNGVISEKIMETIEIIEALDKKRGKTASYLMQKAYCLVAVDCTVRFLGESEEEKEKYTEVVENVWRKRVSKSAGLFSETAVRLWEEIEVAAENAGVWGRIWGRNTRNEALRAVRAYLKEAWAGLGPPVLEVVANKVGSDFEDGAGAAAAAGAGAGLVGSSVPSCNLVGVEETQKAWAVTMRKHAAVKSRWQRGAKLSDANEEAMNKAGDSTTETVRSEDPTLETDRPKESISTRPTKLSASSDRIAENVQTAKILSSTGPGIGSAVEAGHKGPEIPASNDAVRVQRELRSSARELHAAVSDPLPEVLKTVETLRSSTETSNHEAAPQNQTGQEMPTIAEADEVPTAQAQAEKMSTISKNNVEASKQAETEVDASKRSNENDTGNVKETSPNGDAGGNLTGDSGALCSTRKRSLMEAYDTSHTYKRGDEIENSSRSPVRPRLPTPNVQRTSPLKVPRWQALKRRERKRWTSTEEDALREAVLKYGKGNWKFILLDANFAEVFKCRTEVDLKDKWRNMTKYS
ncbi:hypothetical protein vseg_020236 [Gypsophila vaccaria]